MKEEDYRDVRWGPESITMPQHNPQIGYTRLLEPDTQEALPEGAQLAAIDLGSNSFHLNITQVDQGKIRPLHTLSERVQLGEAADTGELTQDAIRRGLACLEQFKRLLD